MKTSDSDNLAPLEYESKSVVADIRLRTFVLMLLILVPVCGLLYYVHSRPADRRVDETARHRLSNFDEYESTVREANKLVSSDAASAIVVLKRAVGKARQERVLPYPNGIPSEGEQILAAVYAAEGSAGENNEFFSYLRMAYPSFRVSDARFAAARAGWGRAMPHATRASTKPG